VVLKIYGGAQKVIRNKMGCKNQLMNTLQKFSLNLRHHKLLLIHKPLNKLNFSAKPSQKY
jgi:hypothetical protein